VLASEYAQPHSLCYDLGCSLGAATLAMRHHLRQPDCRILAIDNSPAMLSRCRQHLAYDSSSTPVELVCADIRDVRIKRASVVVLNFTLQFIPPEERTPLLDRIHSGMLHGGALILSEKIVFGQRDRDKLHMRLHHAFKRANGYSDLEISQKRNALENVLVPETVSAHQERLQGAGFSQVALWFQCLNFVSLLAIK